MTEKIHPVILCGGSGTRLWPRSRIARPKPFLPLMGEQTLFEATLERCSDPAVFAPPIIVTGSAHLAHVTAQSASAAGSTIIVEPGAKNTAPAIALAARHLPADAIMLVCPSDHYIADVAAFTAAARTAGSLAADNWMVAFGIEATSPETGFGYILAGEDIPGQPGGKRIQRFVEKPDLARAQRFLDAGGYSWNGGIFAFRAGALLAELDHHRPEMAHAVERAMALAGSDIDTVHPDADAFAGIAGESIDYAVMENTARAAVVAANMGWSDIGNWEALRDARLRDAQMRDADGNVRLGPGELVACRNVMVDSDGPTVSVIGLEDVVIVVDGNDILVTTTAGAQKVGKLHGAANQ